MSNDDRIEKVYISGKISGIEEHAKVLFADAEETLKGLGYDVVNPMKLRHKHDKSWESYMREDIRALIECDYIYLIKGWRESKGAKLEFAIAESLGIWIMIQEENYKNNKVR